MRAIEKRLDQFCRDHPRFGIPNLMNILVIGTVIVFLLDRFSGYRASYLLSFSASAIFHGQIWRLVSFVFVPLGGDILTVALSLYFYWWIGSSLEREWGTARFSLFYLLGVVFNIVFGLIAGYTSVTYLNLSMFFAFAMLYPETQFLVFFIIPVKVKWRAWIDAAFFALSVVTSLFRLDILNALLPVVALLNFFVFFWTNITDEIAYRRGRTRHQSSHQTIQFKSAVRQQRKKEAERGYRHKCAVCGRTDADHPELEFRYCSRCAGYHCFCQDHIFNHEHFTE